MANKLNFTKAALDAIPIPAPGQRATVHDAKITGQIGRASCRERV